MSNKAELTIDGATYVYIDSSVLRSLEYKAKEYDMMVARERASKLTDVDHAGWQSLVRQDKIVDAIKLYRTLTGEPSLKAAKDVIDAWRAENIHPSFRPTGGFA